MLDPLSQLILFAALALAAVVVAYVAVARRPDRFLMGFLGVVELLLVVQLFAGIVRLLGADGDTVSGWEFIGYLLATLVVLPAGAVWSVGEKSRSGTAVLLVAALVVAVLQVRLEQVWGPGAGG